MSTVIRSEVAKSNLYFLPKHRFYELKHYCLQYPIWKKTVKDLDGYKPDCEIEKIPGVDFWKSNVETVVELREVLLKKMDTIEYCAEKVDRDICKWLLKGVTEGISYSTLAATYNIPCSKDLYYDRFRKFFWLLSKLRG